MRGANASAARFAVIIGDDELRTGSGMVKDLVGEGEQQSIELSRIPAILAERLRG